MADMRVTNQMIRSRHGRVVFVPAQGQLSSMLPASGSAIDVIVHRGSTVINGRPNGFGDKLLAATFTLILNDHGIRAVLDDNMIRDLVRCPIFRPGVDKDAIHYEFNYSPENERYPGGIMRRALDKFAARFRLAPLQVTRKTVGVQYQDMPEVPSVDVVLCSRTGDWTPYRNWPYFQELKNALKERGISYCDLSEERTRGIECLNYISKSKLYLGLETGMSHYASSIAGGKALVIQSGYSTFDFWCSYDYECIAHPVPCQPCFLRSGCPHGHACMREITAESLVRRILARLEAGSKAVH